MGILGSKVILTTTYCRGGLIDSYSNTKLMAMVSIITPTRNSSIFHEVGFWNNGLSNLAPYPRLKKNTNEALIAPRAK
ncbi:hypothetical protein VIBNIAM115_1330012 [Vibrio nigripulchritudo AM115]|nr:hypothetical protein VIBNIAM115_1330012 [Vibrio nigripulchritudo AM115]